MIQFDNLDFNVTCCGVVSVRGTHLFGRRSVASAFGGAEVSCCDFFAAFLAIVAFAVGHLACLFDSMHQNLFWIPRSPLIRQQRGQGFFRQLTGQGLSEFTKLAPGRSDASVKSGISTPHAAHKDDIFTRRSRRYANGSR